MNNVDLYCKDLLWINIFLFSFPLSYLDIQIYQLWADMCKQTCGIFFVCVFSRQRWSRKRQRKSRWPWPWSGPWLSQRCTSASESSVVTAIFWANTTEKIQGIKALKKASALRFSGKNIKKQFVFKISDKCLFFGEVVFTQNRTVSRMRHC